MTTPHVGIFWFDIPSKKLYSCKTPLEEAQARTLPNASFVHGNDDHFTAWDEVKLSNPKWRRLAYEVIPRGRVCWRRRSNTFLILLNPLLKPFEALIKEEFNLKGCRCRFDYSCIEYFTDMKDIEQAFKRFQ